MARTLEEEGYVVVQARNGREALERLAAAAQVDVVLSDVVMPLIGGREFGTRLAAEHPDLPVIWKSRYPRDAVSDERPGQIFLQKPIPPELRAATLREMLAATPRR
jgi:CheY-like chemotaxis protein